MRTCTVCIDVSSIKPVTYNFIFKLRSYEIVLFITLRKGELIIHTSIQTTLVPLIIIIDLHTVELRSEFSLQGQILANKITVTAINEVIKTRIINYKSFSFVIFISI